MDSVVMVLIIFLIRIKQWRKKAGLGMINKGEGEEKLLAC